MALPLNDAVVKVAAQLLAAPDVAARAAIIARAIVEVLPDSACVVHRFVPSAGDAAWISIGLAGEVFVEQASLKADSRLIAQLLFEQQPLIYSGAYIRREDYSHLHVVRSLSSLAYLPLLHEGKLTGAIEILTF